MWSNTAIVAGVGRVVSINLCLLQIASICNKQSKKFKVVGKSRLALWSCIIASACCVLIPVLQLSARLGQAVDTLTHQVPPHEYVELLVAALTWALLTAALVLEMEHLTRPKRVAVKAATSLSAACELVRLAGLLRPGQLHHRAIWPYLVYVGFQVYLVLLSLVLRFDKRDLVPVDPGGCQVKVHGRSGLRWVLNRIGLHFNPCEKGTVAFFHPFADGGGGGERVLWCAVQALQEASPATKVVIYCRSGATAKELVADASARFNVNLTSPIQLVPLQSCAYLNPQRYPRFTLLGQAVGSIRVAWEALRQFVPEVFVDTTGWAFTYPLARLLGCRVCCYVHYPTISADMLARVRAREGGYNNSQQVAGSAMLSVAKVAYYRCVALLYGLCGMWAHVVMVNSSWTQAHIRQLWWWGRPPVLVYPPADTKELLMLPLDRRLKQLYLISVAQFRPEKNHLLQLQAFALCKQRAGFDLAGHAMKVSRLKIVGSCRDAEDESRLRHLQQHALALGLEGCVDWCINPPFQDLKQLLGGAVAGLHTMRDEHFGISVVEYMAAGVIPIAHNSGGPKEDIVVKVLGESGELEPTGFLAASMEEYAAAITKVLVMDQRERLKMAASAQRHARMFSVERFKQSFLQAMLPVLPAGTLETS